MNQKKECMDVHVNGLKFHVQTFGSGVPIMMIMGLGAPGDKWKHNYELLSKWFWCIVPDNRGAGLSDKPEAESYTTEQMADDIIGIMDALDIKKSQYNTVIRLGIFPLMYMSAFRCKIEFCL